MAFLAAENENRQLEDLPQAEFGRVLERFLFPVSTDLILENFGSLTLRSLFFLVFQRIFSIEPERRRFFLYSGVVDPFIFIH